MHTGRGENSIGDRPGIQDAFDYARRKGCIIIVASYDRLTRHTASLDKIMLDPKLTIISTESGEKADRAIIRAQAVRAESVGRVISTTTKKALKTLKASGKRLGNPTNLAEAQRLGADSNRNRSEMTAREYASIIDSINPDGELTKKEIASALNNMSRRTHHGKPWTAGNIRRLLDNIDEASRRSDPLFGMFA